MGKKTSKSIYKNLHTRDLIIIRKKQLLLDEIRSGSFVLKSISAKGWFGLW